MVAAHSVCLTLFCFLAAGQLKCAYAADCKYRVYVRTGYAEYAGTNARVYIEIHGAMTSCPERELKSSSGFRPGKVMQFVITCPCVGALGYWKIRQDNSGPSPDWFLVDVAVRKYPNHYILRSYVYEWLKEGDGKSLSIYAPKPICKYRIKTVTGQMSTAGTNANVYIRLFGTMATARWTRLHHKGSIFRPGKTDYFTITCECIGYHRSILIRRDNNGTDPSWYLNTVGVKPVSRRRTSYIVYTINKWIPDRSLFSDSKHAYYKIVVFTGNQPDAGTDAKVEIAFMYINRYNPFYVVLRNKGRADFKRRGKDKFYAKHLNVRSVTRILVKHDKSGKSPNWYIKKIYVFNRSTGELFKCPCYKWLTTSKPESSFECFQIH